MAVSHVKSVTVADFTGTVTAFNSQGNTTTIGATDLVRPSDWNSAHNQFYTLTGNTNNASTASGANVVLQGMGQVTLVGSTGTIGISVAQAFTNSYFNPQDAYMLVAGAQGQGTFHVQPCKAPNVEFDRIVLFNNLSNASNSTGSITLSAWVGGYTKNGSTLSSVFSTSSTWAVTNSGTVGDWTNNSGVRAYTIPITSALTEGQYWVGIGVRSTSAGANCTLSQMLCSQLNSNFAGIIGVGSNASIQQTRGLGVFSVSTTGVPGTIAFSDLRGSASLVLRQPAFYFVSGTV